MRIFAADIGGTYSRFGLFETESSAAGLHCLAEARISSSVPTFGALLDRLSSTCAGLSPDMADAAALAVAGPVHDRDSIQLTNLPFAVNTAELRRRAPGIRAALLNDFEAQALACLTPVMARASIMAGTASPPENADESNTGPAVFCFPVSGRHSPCALIGAGTGLGMAILTPDTSEPGGARVLASEGGHAAFAFADAAERAFGDFTAARKGLAYARGEDVLSGSGLALLHEFLTGRMLEPAGITADPGFADSGTCLQFARFYGRACRHLALTCLPSDLVITGGIAARCPSLARHTAFREEFLNAPGRHRSLLEGVRIWLNTDQNSGLWGAALAGLRSCGAASGELR